MDKLSFLQDWYQKVWIEGDMGAIEAFFDPDSVANGLMRDLQVGPEDFRALVPAILRLVRDQVVRIERHVETDDWLWALIVVEARAARTMKPVRIDGQVMMRFEGGKIAEAFNHFDYITFFEQVELMPADTMALCFSGEVLG